MTNELKSLIQKRKTIKSNLTRFANYVANLGDTINLTELKMRFEKAEPLLSEFENIHAEIIILEENSDVHFKELETFETQYFDILSKAKDRIMKDEQVKTTANAVQSNSDELIMLKSQVKLPKLNMPTFDGNLDNWLSFRDSFNLIVHQNNQLEDIQKFQYLKSALTKDAAHVIDSLDLSATNYKNAWEILIERYENKRLIVQSHVTALFDLPTITRESAISLTSLLDQVKSHMRALNALQVNTTDIMIIHLITSKFDSDTRKEWESRLNTELPTMAQITEFLNKRCHYLTAIDKAKVSNVPSKHVSTHSNTKHNVNKTSQRTVSNVAVKKQNQCIVCNEIHFLQQCSQFLALSAEERLQK